MNGPRSELFLRFWSGLAMAALALGTLWLGGIVFDLLWTLISIWIFAEWIRLAGCAYRQPRLLLGALALAAAGYALIHDQAGPAWLSVAAGSIVQALFPGSVKQRAWAAGGLLYAAVVLMALLLLRHDDRLGAPAIAWMFAVVWTTDIAAYFAGRRFGGPKLMPSVSPKKTWSGFIGGTLAGTAAGALVGMIAARQGFAPLTPVALAILSACASIAGQMGDLAESALKRRAGVKDSGHLIPGHGGVMDRLDAFWAVALICLAGIVLRDLLAS